MLRPSLILPLVVACGHSEPVPDPADRAVRVSMALRGIRPTVDELALVRANPALLPALADQWVQSPEFTETVVDWHAEWLLLRHDARHPLPSLGPLEGSTGQEMVEALSEGPLRLVAHIVDAGRPYTDVFATPEVAVNSTSALIWGLPWQEGGEPWQLTEWTDGRPAAGLLSDSSLWMRHISSDTNHHRARANIVHTTWLCEDLSQRTLDLGPLDLSDPDAVDNALSTDPGCVGCHQTLDPLAASFTPFDRYILPSEVESAYEAGCVDDACYPLRLYRPETEPDRHALGLPPAALAGVATDDLGALGKALTEDPRFAPCVARQWASWMGQRPLWDVPNDEVERLASVFVQTNYDLRAMALAAAAGADFGALEPRVARPEQVARDIEALTGFSWMADVDGGDCLDQDLCWGAVDLSRNARWGFRSVAGGVDGYDSVRPVHDPSPMRHLALARLAEEAAAHVVAEDMALPPAKRRLLRELVSDPPEGVIGIQAQALHQRILGQTLPDADPDLESTLTLWQTVYDRSSDADRAWATVIAAMLQSPDRVLY